MATVIKHNVEPMARKLSAATEKDATNPFQSGNQEFKDAVTDYLHHITGAGGSPKSVIRDDTPSTNSSYYQSCSSTSSSAERMASANSQQQEPSHPRLVSTFHKKIKSQHLARKGFSTLVDSNAGTDAMIGASANCGNADPIYRGSNGSQLSTHGMRIDLDPRNKVAVNPPLIAVTTQVCKPSKCHESHMSKGLSLTCDLEDVNDSKLSHYQAAAPLNSLINTLMQQYKPSFVVEDGTTLRHASLNEILANVRNGGFNDDSIKPKLIASKWVDDDKWMHTKLTSTSAQTLSTSRVPLFKLGHNKHTLPILSEPQSCHLQTDASMWNKDILNNEVEKLTNAVSCAQACLEQIQPIPPPPRNATSGATNPFLAQGVFQNRVYPMVVQGTLKPNSQADPVVTRGVLGNSHAAYTGTSTLELFWSSPIKAPDTQNASSNTNFSAASQSPQKEAMKPSAVHFKLTTPTTIQDTASRGDLTHMGEHFHVQKHEKSGAPTTMSCMKDASTEITPSTSHRDIGTQMTPSGSLRHLTPSHSPQRCRAMPPARQDTPMHIPAPPANGIIDMSRMNPLEVERWRRARLQFQGHSDDNQVQHSLCKSFDSTWSSREEEEEDIAKGLRHLDLEDLKRNVLEARASAWKEATRLKLLAKYERKETKIQAWEDLQAAKAEADLKKLEMKLEKKRIQKRTKIASKLDAAHKRAEERRAAVKANRFEAMQKTCHRADEMRDEANLFRASYPLCACFSRSFD